MDNMTRRKRPQGPRRRQARGGNQRQLIPHPPPIQNIGITYSTRLRFVTNAAVNATVITFQNLLDVLNFALTAVTAADVFQAVRVRAVEMWATPLLGSAVTCECEFLGSGAGATGDSSIHTDTSMGIEPAHVLARPAPRSGIALFQPSANIAAFVLTCPSGTVVDVELTLRGRPNTAVATQNVPAGATPGAWYYRGLDGLAVAATVFVPQVNSSGTD
jgi:hypothetical protein